MVVDRRDLLKWVFGAVGIAVALALIVPAAVDWWEDYRAAAFQRHCATAVSDQACESTPIGRVRALPRTGAGTREALILVMRPVIRDAERKTGAPPSKLIDEAQEAEACITEANAPRVRTKIEGFVVSLATSRAQIESMSAAFKIGSAAKNVKTPLGQFVPDALTWGSDALSAAAPIVDQEKAEGFLMEVIATCFTD